MQLFREEDYFHKDTHDTLVTVTIVLPHAQYFPTLKTQTITKGSFFTSLKLLLFPNMKIFGL